jgi:hypothetical protein
VDLRWIFRGSFVDLSWIFRGSFVDLSWIFRRFASIFVDFRRFSSICVDANYVIGLARFSEAGLRSNEVLFFGFFPFAIIFLGGGVDLEWIFESSRRHGLAQRADLVRGFLPTANKNGAL